MAVTMRMPLMIVSGVISPSIGLFWADGAMFAGRGAGKSAAAGPPGAGGNTESN